METDNKQIKELMLANDALADELKRVEYYAYCCEREIIDQINLRKELFDKTISFMEQHLPFGEVPRELMLEVIEDYKKEMMPLFTKTNFKEE